MVMEIKRWMVNHFKQIQHRKFCMLDETLDAFKRANFIQHFIASNTKTSWKFLDSFKVVCHPTFNF